MVSSFIAEIFQMITVTLTHELKNWFQGISQIPVDICDEEICENNLEPQDEITVMSVQMAPQW